MRRGVAAAVVALASLLLLGTGISAFADDGPATDATPTPTPSPSVSLPAPRPTPSSTAAAGPSESGPVRDVRWTFRSRTSVLLTWSAPADATGLLRYRVVAGLSTGEDRTIETTNPAVTLTKIPPGTRIVPEITADDRLAQSGADTWAAWTQPAVAPSAPTAVTLAAAVSGASLVAVWSVPADDGGADIESYRVQLFRGTGTGEVVAEQTPNAATHTATFGGLNAGSVYTVGVAASNGVATGSQRLSAAATVPIVAAASDDPTPAATAAIPAAQAVGPSPSAVVASAAGHLSPVVPLALSVAAVALAAASGIAFLLQRRRVE